MFQGNNLRVAFYFNGNAKNIYPWLPVKYLLKDKYNSERKIKEIKSPIFNLTQGKGYNSSISYGKEIIVQ